MNLIELSHDTDPRYMIAPAELPDKIEMLDLGNWRYGKLLIAKVGDVICKYKYDPNSGDWIKNP